MSEIGKTTMEQSPAIGATAARVRQEKLTYLTPIKFQRLEDCLRAANAMGVPGDFLEFGIALGGSAIVIAEQARAAGRAFHGFDVFAMIPEPTSVHDDERSKERYKTISSGKSKGIGGDLYYGYRDNLYEEVKSSFARHGLPVDGSGIVLHKGLFEDTWPSYRGTDIAFAHIDCDWYDPVTFCLNGVAGRLRRGGRILLDDYHDYGGCKKATDEFLAGRSDFRVHEGRNLILEKI